MIKTNLKTTIKKFEAAVAAGDKEQCQALYKLTVKKLDQAVAKGILKKNTASRKISRLTKAVNNVQ